MDIRTDVLTDSNAVNSLGSETEKWLLNGKIGEFIPIEITLSSADGTTKTIYDSRITAKHVVIDQIITDTTGFIVR